MKFSTLFDTLQDSEVLQKSRTYARWTVPSLLVQPRPDGKATLVTGDFQTDGAVLVNGLASKMAGLLFPSTHPFMRISLSESDLTALGEILGDTSEVNGMLADIENNASQRVFRNSSFNQLVMALKHLIVTGNVCVFRDSERSRTICYGLNNFSVRRDGLGRVVDAVIKESTFFPMLDQETQDKLLSEYPNKYDEDNPYREALTVYTRIVREPNASPYGGDLFHVATQVEDIQAPSRYQGTYTEYTCPWIFPTWSLVTGENYGRGLVEDHAGGFAKLSEVGLAMTLYEIESLRLLNLVGTSASNSKDELAVAETGAWIGASPQDVATYESGSTKKLEIVRADLDNIFARLARAFMYQGNTRDKERVTAYEIRQEALEVEASMGGAFSTLAETLQLPLSYILIQEEDPEFLVALQSNTEGSRVDISTGISALGRATKVQNILQALQEGSAAVELAVASDNRVDPYRVMDIVYQGRSVNPTDIFKSEQQLREEAEAAQQEQEASAQMQQAQAQANMAAAVPEIE